MLHWCGKKKLEKMLSEKIHGGESTKFIRLADVKKEHFCCSIGGGGGGGMEVWSSLPCY